MWTTCPESLPTTLHTFCTHLLTTIGMQEEQRMLIEPVKCCTAVNDSIWKWFQQCRVNHVTWLVACMTQTMLCMCAEGRHWLQWILLFNHVHMDEYIICLKSIQTLKTREWSIYIKDHRVESSFGSLEADGLSKQISCCDTFQVPTETRLILICYKLNLIKLKHIVRNHAVTL